MLWNKIKNNLIVALSMLEIANFHTSYGKLKDILENDLRELEVFVDENKQNVIDLKGEKSVFSRYIFSIFIGFCLVFIIVYLFYNSPKLQNKKFV